MADSNKDQYLKSFSNIKKARILFIMAWTLLIIIFSAALINSHYKSEYDNARNIARGHLIKDYLYRRWVSQQGGMYLPLSEEIQPNPYLINVPEKNIKTASGRNLTLVNPAYMTRLVHNFAYDEYKIKGHITSTNPLRPGNYPDNWEVSVLDHFHRSAERDFVEICEIGGKKYMRYMQAMITEKGCLKCHGFQGYKENDIRGGISVSVPWEEFETNIVRNSVSTAVFSFIIWISGLSGVIFTFRKSRENLEKIEFYNNEISEREKQLALVFENNSDAIIWINSNDFIIINCNRSAEKLLLQPEKDLVGNFIGTIFTGRAIPEELANPEYLVKNSKIESSIIDKTGKDISVEITVTHVVLKDRSIYQYIISDITLKKIWVEEIEAANQELAAQNEEFEAINEELLCANRELIETETRLQKSLKEKELLVRELYHRTKNTMQVIRGMLSIQAEKYRNSRNINKLVEITDRRIQAISLVHQMLIQTKDLSRISIKNYIEELSGLILKSFGITNGDDIQVALEIEDLEFLLDTAIPFGLIFNELMTNTLKYAFPDNRPGNIGILLQKQSPDNITFIYKDNGIGLPDEYRMEYHDSLGMELIFNIGEQQMLGKIQIENINGFHFTLTFPSNLYEARV